MFWCCVPTCKNNNNSAKMFRFPYLDEPVSIYNYNINSMNRLANRLSNKTCIFYSYGKL